jgi:hypothetical protein
MIFLQYDKTGESVTLNVDKSGAIALRKILETFIESDVVDHSHLMSPDWGGAELDIPLTYEVDDKVLIHHLKITYLK